MIRVTVRDLTDGKENSVEIEDDYVIVCAGECFVAHTQAHLNGTHILTVKGRKDRRPIHPQSEPKREYGFTVHTCRSRYED